MNVHIDSHMQHFVFVVFTRSLKICNFFFYAFIHDKNVFFSWIHSRVERAEMSGILCQHNHECLFFHFKLSSNIEASQLESFLLDISPGCFFSCTSHPLNLLNRYFISQQNITPWDNSTFPYAFSLNPTSCDCAVCFYFMHEKNVFHILCCGQKGGKCVGGIGNASRVQKIYCIN